MIGQGACARDDDVRPLAQSVGDNEIERTHLVAAEADGQEIVALEPQFRTANGSLESRCAVDRRWLGDQRKPR